MKRSGGITAVAALLGLLIALTTPGVAGAETPSPAERLAQESVLRLAELPAGYVLTPSWYCAPAWNPRDEEGIYEREEHRPPTPYETFVEKYDPATCLFEYERLYRPTGSPPRPPRIESFAMVTPSAAAAEAGFGVGAELATNAFGLPSLYPGGPAPALGDEALLFHDNLLREWGRTHLPGTIVLWRDGAIIAGVLAGGAKPAANDATASHYAAVQQTIVEAPRPYEEAEAESVPTYLGNPRLGLPVYWLGKEFAPGHGLGTSYFLAAYPHEHIEHPEAGRRMTAQYNHELFLDSWTPAGWRRFAKTEVGRRQWTWRCTRSRTIKLADGHAVIYGSYKKGYATCPSFRPHHFIAHVFLPGAVVAIGEPVCSYCQGYLSPRFESFAAVEAIVRGLHRWKPDDGS